MKRETTSEQGDTRQCHTVNFVETSRKNYESLFLNHDVML